MGTDENFHKMMEGDSGISLTPGLTLSADSINVAKIKFPLPTLESLTFFETLCIHAIKGALKNISLDMTSANTALVLATTKGNIDLLGIKGQEHRVKLFPTAQRIGQYFSNPNVPRVISNACISGVMALQMAKRMLYSGDFKHIVVVGGDVLSKFVISGFGALQAISPFPCKPFDEARKGITLGEAAAAVVLTAHPEELDCHPKIKVLGGGLSNDANHISGPSRTGDELAWAVLNALKESGTEKDNIDFISAHGTGTLYNDEMESKAFSRLEMNNIPLNSLKGYFGHTLGAAGLLESVMSIASLEENTLIPSKGFEKLGVSKPLNIIQEQIKKPLQCFLKTASGFGGCNAAILFKKTRD